MPPRKVAKAKKAEAPKVVAGSCVHYVKGTTHQKAYVMQVATDGSVTLLVPQHYPPRSTPSGIKFDASAKDGTWHWPESR